MEEMPKSPGKDQQQAMHDKVEGHSQNQVEAGAN